MYCLSGSQEEKQRKESPARFTMGLTHPPALSQSSVGTRDLKLEMFDGGTQRLDTRPYTRHATSPRGKHCPVSCTREATATNVLHRVLPQGLLPHSSTSSLTCPQVRPGQFYTCCCPCCSSSVTPHAADRLYDERAFPRTRNAEEISV